MRGVVLVAGGSHVDQDAVHWLASCSRANISIPVTNTPCSAILSHTIKTHSHSIAYSRQPLRHRTDLLCIMSILLFVSLFLCLFRRQVRVREMKKITSEMRIISKRTPRMEPRIRLTRFCMEGGEGRTGPTVGGKGEGVGVCRE